MDGPDKPGHDGKMGEPTFSQATIGTEEFFRLRIDGEMNEFVERL